MAAAEKATRPHAELAAKRCAACSGKVPTVPREEAMQTASMKLPSWKYIQRPEDVGGDTLSRQLRMSNFKAAIELLNRIADVAEAENHHPDLHLTGWRNLQIDVNTHSVKGITEGDFILAAKIEDLLPAPTTASAKH